MDKVNLTRENLAALAPKLASLSEEVLFGDIWQRPALSPRDRSLITLSALVAMYRPEQLAWHLKLARKTALRRAKSRSFLPTCRFTPDGQRRFRRSMCLASSIPNEGTLMPMTRIAISAQHFEKWHVQISRDLQQALEEHFRYRLATVFSF